MPKFSTQSKTRLSTCHYDLQLICNTVIEHLDFSVLQGHRSLENQQKAFKAGKSKLDGIKLKSKHQSTPSMAVDIAPYPIDFKDIRRFDVLAGAMLSAAAILKKQGAVSHDLRWGGDWDRDADLNDQKFNDLGHFELVGADQ